MEAPVIVDLPSTDTSAVNRTMVDLRESAGAVALGRVLTLLIITEDGPEAEAAIQAANDASREHPCRVLVLARGIRRAASRLDAQIRIGGDAGASEVIVLRMYGPLADQGGSIVVPLLLPDAPIVAWWPGEAPASPADDPVGHVAGRRITDVSSAKSPSKALAKLRQRYHPGDTDLAWSRITSWRALLTAALDQPPHEAVTRASVAGAADSASADLLTGWLASRLNCPVTRIAEDVAGGQGGQIAAVRLERPSGSVELRRLDAKSAVLSHPGQPDRRVALSRRTTRECLAEELRRLDPDEIFAEAIEAMPTGRTRSSKKVTA
jgi:glucose-6-phosphate dehydrogenase assembly protein OpcA